MLTYIRLATSRLFSPSATSSDAARSASVRLSHPLTGLRADGVQCRRRTPSSRSRDRTRAMSAAAPVGWYPWMASGELVDGLAPVRLPGVQDAEVFGRGGLGPRIGVLRGCLGQAARVPPGQAQAVRRGRGDGRVAGITGGEGLGGAGHRGGQLILARGQRGARHPGRGGRVSQEQPPARVELGAGLAEVARRRRPGRRGPR